LVPPRNCSKFSAWRLQKRCSARNFVASKVIGEQNASNTAIPGLFALHIDIYFHDL
jgi:hypothetical protein